jgi:hypothetical protein
MIALLKALKLKPEKGRRKDLRKIEDLITDLHDMVSANRSP